MSGVLTFDPAPAWAGSDLAQVRDLLLQCLPPALGSSLEERHIALPAGVADPLRPLLVLTAARGAEGLGDRAVRLAAAIQMIHGAALLHDRLGEAPGSNPDDDATAHGLHDREAMDILLGDFWFSRASCIVIEDGEERIVRDMIATSMASAEAQATLVGLRNHPERCLPARYLDVASEKMSLLLSLALRVGAVLGRAPRGHRDALSAFGARCGRALRIVEDLAWWEEADAGGTLPNGGMAYHHPLLLLWEEEGRAAWTEAVCEVRSPMDRPPEALRSRLKNAGYLDRSREQVRGIAAEAGSHLDRHPTLRAGADLERLVRDRLLRAGDSVSEEAS